jgi:hypothetical protein
MPVIRMVGGSIMAFTYDITTNRGKVRLLSVDSDSTYAVFEDDEIDAFLSMEGNNVKRAAAQALDTIASNDAYRIKKVSLLDVSADGVSVADVLHKRSAMLRDQADKEEASESGGSFDIAEWVVNDFGYRQQLINDAARNL